MNSTQENKLDGIHFYKLFMNKFPYQRYFLENMGVRPSILNYDSGLYDTTTKVVSFYLGQLMQSLYLPTNKNNNKLSWKNFPWTITKYCSNIFSKLKNNNIKRLSSDTETVDMCDWVGRKNCYNLIKNLKTYHDFEHFNYVESLNQIRKAPQYQKKFDALMWLSKYENAFNHDLPQQFFSQYHISKYDFHYVLSGSPLTPLKVCNHIIKALKQYYLDSLHNAPKDVQKCAKQF